MRLVFKDTEKQVNNAITIAQKNEPCHETIWHYHQQYELIYIKEGSGVRFVGDHVSSFESGQLVLISPNLPHLWKNNDDCTKMCNLVIKFDKSFMGPNTFDNPVFACINEMLSDSKYGISFSKEFGKSLEKELMNCQQLSSAEKNIFLLSLLLKLANSKCIHQLSTSDMRQQGDSNKERLDRVLKYISDNYEKDIDLQEIADIACLTSNSFCRFFKKVTNKSFKQYLNEVRIRNASRLLVQKNYQISDVCYEVGFNSITNFNKQFKMIIGKTPREYRMAM
ncbi:MULTISPECIES: AraC family transcriptional regulator [Flammeovirga]|uniref:AraC family transcriptional regulator n=1 Tax=Flammeovirga agarivorans TaxID=2726742 RepID=A0A7X8SJU8_9BACT|nr:MULTISPECIES: AraC family transcriptional regulator [Flammeovirga]NLR91559.1 AraC family transcriptional regulator [Flammeovirga agarivorans]